MLEEETTHARLLCWITKPPLIIARHLTLGSIEVGILETSFLVPLELDDDDHQISDFRNIFVHS